MAADAAEEAGPKLLALAREGAGKRGGDAAATAPADVAASEGAAPAPRGSLGHAGEAATLDSTAIACSGDITLLTCEAVDDSVLVHTAMSRFKPD